MRNFLYSLILVLSFSSAVLATEGTSESLLDVASPEEVAAELGLTPAVAELSLADRWLPERLSPMALEDHNQSAKLDLTQYFPVVVVVNKHENAATGQRVTVYHRGALKWEFDASTGREQWEIAKSGRKYFSVTSTGWFAPTRTYEKYYSKTWLADMNHSIFFNGGLALHATTPDHYDELGRRASGGCVRLHPKNAKLLYDLVMTEGKGQVPSYTWNGQIERDNRGQIVYRQHWNTIIIIEDVPGN